MNNSNSKKIIYLLCILIITAAGYLTYKQIFPPGDLIPSQQHTDSIVNSGASLSGQHQTEVVQHGQDALNEAKKIRKQVRQDVANSDARSIADSVKDELRILLRERNGPGE